MSYDNLFVAKLPRSLKDAELEKIFEAYSPIGAKVMLDASTGKSKGFGFVLFATEEEGMNAYRDLNRKCIKSSQHSFNLVMYPSQHSGRAAISVSNALYIRNIPISVSQGEVERFLRSFGTLSYCAMREDHHGNPVWVVYAEYDCLDCSKNVLQKLHGNSSYFDSPPVMVKYADSDEAKRERRRRREEGKLAPAPASRSTCAFPPPRLEGNHEGVHGKSLDAGASFPPLISNSNSNDSSNGNGAVCGAVCGAVSRKGVVSTDSVTCSLALNHSSDVSSASSSAYREADHKFTTSSTPAVETIHPSPMFFTTPLVSLPTMHPVGFPCSGVQTWPSVMQEGGNGGKAPSAIFILDGGQQLLLASNTVNVLPSNYGSLPQRALPWHPGHALYTTPPPYSYVRFP